MKRVLHVIDHMGCGGAQVLLQDIFTDQSSNDLLFLFSLRRVNDEIVVTHTHYSPATNNSKFSLKSFFDLRKTISKNDITILHCHLLRSQVYGLALKIFFFPRIRLIIHEHGGVFKGGFFYRFFLYISQYWADFIIAISNSTKNELAVRARVKEERIVMLPNFISLTKFDRGVSDEQKNEFLKRFEIDDSVPIITFVGRLSKMKGCDVLIKALSKIDTSFHLIVAGVGSELDMLKKLVVEKNLSSRVSFVGFVDSLIVYSVADIQVVPSNYEPFGLVALEAQAARVPVIASRTGGLEENIVDGETGLLFTPGDDNELSGCVKKLINDRTLRDRLVQGAYGRIGKYSLKNYLDTLEKYYSKKHG